MADVFQKYATAGPRLPFLGARGDEKGLRPLAPGELREEDLDQKEARPGASIALRR